MVVKIVNRVREPNSVKPQVFRRVDCAGTTIMGSKDPNVGWLEASLVTVGFYGVLIGPNGDVIGHDCHTVTVFIPALIGST